MVHLHQLKVNTNYIMLILQTIAGCQDHGSCLLKLLKFCFHYSFSVDDNY